MNESKPKEVTLLCVWEQYRFAESLTFELHRIGITVFVNCFDNSDDYNRIVNDEYFIGIKRAAVIVLLFSKEYQERVWNQNHRRPFLEYVKEKYQPEVLPLLFDETPLPKELPKGRKWHNPDSYETSKIAKEIEQIMQEGIMMHEANDSSRPGREHAPKLTSIIGEAIWNYSGGRKIEIGRDEFTFQLKGSQCSETSLYLYPNAPSLQGVSLAKGYTSFNQIFNAKFLDYTGEFVTPCENEIVVLRNSNGFYAAVQVLKITERNEDGIVAELRFRYLINSDKSDDFSERVDIDSVSVEGFRSIKKAQLRNLRPIVAMIGPNGGGKTNFLLLFEMMQKMLNNRKLALFVGKNGGADDFLFEGSKETKTIKTAVTLRLGSSNYYDYRFSLESDKDNNLIFSGEQYRLRSNKMENVKWRRIEESEGKPEAGLINTGYCPRQPTLQSRIAGNIVHLLGNLEKYHFPDTSPDSAFNKSCDFEDNYRLSPNGSNLAAVLLQLQQNDKQRYDWICYQIQRILPGFLNFDLPVNSGKVSLRWISKKQNKSYGAHLTSDGTLRFFALTTLLHLPTERLPAVLFLDEPELGLHPDGIALIGGLIRSLSSKKQIFVATQSPLLVDCFELDEVVVFNSTESGSLVKAVSSEEYQHWIDDGFGPGDLWTKRLLGGLP